MTLKGSGTLQSQQLNSEIGTFFFNPIPDQDSFLVDFVPAKRQEIKAIKAVKKRDLQIEQTKLKSQKIEAETVFNKLDAVPKSANALTRFILAIIFLIVLMRLTKGFIPLKL